MHTAGSAASAAGARGAFAVERVRRGTMIGLTLLLLAAMGSMAVASTDGVMELTLEDAIRYGLTVSPAMKRAQLAVKLAELNLRNAEVNVRATVTPLELERAREAYENAVYRAMLQRIETALDVEKRYYEVLKAADTLALRETATDRAHRQLEIARFRHSAGQLTDVQLREAEQNLLRSELEEQRAAHQLSLAWFRLEQMTGLQQAQLALVDKVAFVPEKVELEQALAEAQELRFEVSEARQAIANAERAVSLADNEYTPRIELDRALIALAQAELQAVDVLDTIQFEVTSAVLALEDLQGRYYLAHDNLDLAEASLHLAELRYNNGLNTIQDVLNAQSALAEAEVQAVSANYDYNVARAEFLSAMGRGFERWPQLLEESME